MPYFLQYDLMILAIPVVLLANDLYIDGYNTVEIITLVSLWLMPLVSWPLVIFTHIQIYPFILYLVLVMVILRAKKSVIVNY